MTWQRNDMAKARLYSFKQSSSTQHFPLPACKRLEVFTAVLVSIHSYETLGSRFQHGHRAVTEQSVSNAAPVLQPGRRKWLTPLSA